MAHKGLQVEHDVCLQGRDEATSLASGAMTPEETQRARRRGYWMKRAREHAAMTLAAAVHAAGLAEGSGSTVSRWEAGTLAPRIDQLERLAEVYRVPISLFTEPAETDDERLDRLMHDAAERERADWGAALGQPGEGVPAAERHTPPR